MTKQVSCFFAYPSNPPALSEVMESVVKGINDSHSSEVIAESWRMLSVSGKLIITEVCSAIDRCGLFACDLTYLNPNVLFELGYAMARHKRAWITLDPSIAGSKDNYSKFSLLSTVGYAEYHNAYRLVNDFFVSRPFMESSPQLLNTLFQARTQSSAKQLPAILYLKTQVETHASARLSRKLAQYKLPTIVDDPQEISSQTLAWYIQNIIDSYALLVHFLGEDHSDSTLRNARYSLVSGIAYGFGKPLLMLAHSPFSSPIDYKALLVVHATAEECIRAVDAWIPPVKDMYSKKVETFERDRIDRQKTALLQRVDLGDHIAENEKQDLLDYFIETTAYIQALKTRETMIYVGRKGTGKTANLFKIADALSQDVRNHVCIIKPISYELEGVLFLLRSSISKSEKGYLVESLWKFLIYTELVRGAYQSFIAMPSHHVPTAAENALSAFVESHQEFILPEFTVRMEEAIQDLCKIDFTGRLTQQRVKISEILHTNLLASIRTILGAIWEKKPRVCVLVDNLDKAWLNRSDLGELSEFLFGLLSVSRTITEEFQKHGTSTWLPVNLSLTVFLRSDIFAFIMSEAREGDKLSFMKIYWNDGRLLQRVIEERIVSSLDRKISSEEIWQQLFVESVNGIPTKDYLVNQIVPRPRDIIYFCKAALASAVNHKHTRVEESDILQAEREYSQYAFNSLLSETSPQMDNIEALLYEFAGAYEIVSRKQIEQFMIKAHIPEVRTQNAIDLLCDSMFLGLETSWNSFQFLYDDDKSKVLRTLARTTKTIRALERYKVNIPYHSFLEIRRTQ